MSVDMDEKYEYLGLCGACDRDIARFVQRDGGGALSCRLSMDDFLADTEMIAVVELLKLDAVKFYYLIVFLYDYTCDVCFHGVEIEEGGHEMMWLLIDRGRRLIAGEKVLPLKTDARCTFKIQGRSYKVDDTTAIAILLYWIHLGMIQMSPTDGIWALNWLIDDYDSHRVERSESMSVAIWCFASLLLRFFKGNPQFAGRAPKGSGLSLNKQLLASKLVYLLGFSRNESFCYSDEALKGFMRQYRGRDLPARGEIYG